MDLKSIHGKHAINLPHELALIVKKIDGALNDNIATLGFNEYPALLLMVGSGLNVLAAAILYFLGPLVMSLGVLVAAFFLSIMTDLLTVSGELVGGMNHGILRGLSAALLAALF